MVSACRLLLAQSAHESLSVHRRGVLSPRTICYALDTLTRGLGRNDRLKDCRANHY